MADFGSELLSGLKKGFEFATANELGDYDEALGIQESLQGVPETLGFVIGAATTGTAYAKAQMGSKGVELRPYKKGLGHHVPAKVMFKDDPNYNEKTALAIPLATLEKLGINHKVVTGAQKSLYTAFFKSGQKLTWEAVKGIETAALVKGGMESSAAEATVDKAIKSVQGSGVTEPSKIPWGDN